MNAFFRCTLAFGLLSLAAPGHAVVTRCVSNATQLSAALTEAGNSSESLFQIKLRLGTYQASAQSGAFVLWQRHSNQIVEVSGGWTGDNGSCNNINRDASATTLLGTSIEPALWVVGGVSQDVLSEPVDNSLVYVHGLTLTNTNFTPAYEIDPDFEDYHFDMYETESACLNGVAGGNTNELVFERLVMRNCNAPNNGHASARVENIGSKLTMRNIVARGGSAKINGGMYVGTKSGTSRLTHFSITGNKTADNNSDPTAGLDLRAISGGVVHLSNSVTWGNTNNAGDPALDLRVISGLWSHYDKEWDEGSAGSAYLNRVHRGDDYFASPNASIHGNESSTGDPRFVAPGMPFLMSDSPLIDSGNTPIEGGSGSYDAAGKTRQVGGSVDVGAYEYVPQNTAPSLGNASLPITSAIPVGTVVYTFAASDDGQPAPGTLIYSIQSVQVTSGLSNAFTLNSNGKLTLTQALPSQPATYTLTVKACDLAPLCDTGTLTVTWTPPAQSGGTIFKDGFDN